MTSTTVRVEARTTALTDIPEGLDQHEHHAYVAGYAAAALRYAHRHPLPCGDTAEELHEATVEYERERHPSCHRAGLRALAKHQEKFGTLPNASSAA